MIGKPRIIILMHYLELGGAEISLIGLLQALDPTIVDVDLFIYSHQGPLMKYIPEWVNLLPEKMPYSIIERPIAEALKNYQFGVVAGRLLSKIKHRKYLKKKKVNPALDASIFQFVADCTTPLLPNINPEIEYDLCISFLTPHNIGRDKVKAKKKLAWIHTDYSTISVNAEQELPVWNSYDYIASISPDVTNSFLSTFPSLKNKIIEIENIISPEFIRKRANVFSVEKEIPKTEHTINLLSIGRFSHPKNFDNLPDIVKRILANGIVNLKWYIIGFGGEEQLIRSKIKETGMENHVILLGKKDNPYPYIKACDIYVQPSRYEGKSITVREAQILGKPVVITNYPTASSQVRDGYEGVIVPLDNNGCAKGIVDFILNAPLQKEIVSNLSKNDYGNFAEVEKIYSILN